MIITIKNDDGEANSSNIIVIGAGEGATLGALWMASEWRRLSCTVEDVPQNAGILNLKAVGPKKIYLKANELKMIVYNLDDLKFAEIESRKVSNNCILYLQPEWSKREKIMPIIVDYVMKNPKWKVSLQTHKYLNIP